MSDSLLYDRWSRNTFRLFLFDPAKGAAEYEALQLQEDPGFAAGAFSVEDSSARGSELLREGFVMFGGANSDSTTELAVTKQFSFGPAPRGCEIACELRLKFKSPLQRPMAVGLESVTNLLAPDAADRFFRDA